LTWVVLVSLFMALSLPLAAPSAMSLGQWVSLAILGGYIVVAVYGLVRIEKAPRDVAGALGAAAVVALLSAINLARVFAARGSTLGPAAILSLLVAWSAALGIFIALIASWRGVRVRDHAI
jgi:hypothetical protein